MVESYFLLYQKARKLVEEGGVKLENIKEGETTVYYFNVNDYAVSLTLSKLNNVWKRDWTCSCRSHAIYQDKIECKHKVAAEYFLIQGGLK